MRKTIVAALAGLMVLAGATVAFAQTDSTTTTTQDDSTDRLFGGYADVLDGLVTDGTLTPEQADAVVAAFQEHRSAMRANRDAVRAAMQEAWSDGVITEDELSALPNGGQRLTDPDGPLAEYWEDGQLTQEELDEARENGLGFGRGGHHRRGF
jgi:Spy/CpxP family protein refolding chaperone